MHLGILIKQIRQEKGINTAEFERITGIKYPQMSRYENGKTELKEDKCLEILMKGFDIPYSQAKDTIQEFKEDEARSNMSNKKKVEITIKYLELEYENDPDFFKETVEEKLKEGDSPTLKTLFGHIVQGNGNVLGDNSGIVVSGEVTGNVVQGADKELVKKILEKNEEEKKILHELADSNHLEKKLLKRISKLEDLELEELTEMYEFMQKQKDKKKKA